MTPQDFIAEWGAPSRAPGSAYTLNEEHETQSHFLDLCELLQVPKPGSTADCKFEEKSQLIAIATVSKRPLALNLERSGDIEIDTKK
jgi:hypothetical protein